MAERKHWSRLDNAAKIFPPTSTKRDTKVFRFVCELTEPVDSGILQSALEETIQEFPLYRSILKKGLFWYYLEESNLRPQVEKESLPACSPIYNQDGPACYSVSSIIKSESIWKYFTFWQMVPAQCSFYALWSLLIWQKSIEFQDGWPIMTLPAIKKIRMRFTNIMIKPEPSRK